MSCPSKCEEEMQPKLCILLLQNNPIKAAAVTNNMIYLVPEQSSSSSVAGVFSRKFLGAATIWPLG